MSLHVAFRVDATTQSGTGHFMRCLTLARALAGQASVRFVSRRLPPHLIDMVRANGFDFAILPVEAGDAGAMTDGDLAHSSWLGTSQAQDACDTATALGDATWDWLVVDHYALDARWESAVRNTATRIMAIDDLADRSHDCDVLLDQNLYRDMPARYSGKVPAHCRLLLGPRYALLRPEFAEARKRVRPRDGQVERVLVFFGGVDAADFTGKAVRALSGLVTRGIAVDVIIGPQHPRRAEIEAGSDTLGYTCHVQTDRMAELTAAADVAVAAGGSATWERCCLGLPAFCITTADNHREQLSDAAAAGLLYSPSMAGDAVEFMRRHVEGLVENPPLLQWLSRNAMDAVDGRGVQRCLAELGVASNPRDAATLTVRPATQDDAAMAWRWRNDPSTRRYSFDPAPISIERHMEWWQHSLANAKRWLLVGELGARPMGILRLDVDAPEAAVMSIYLDPAMTGHGLGAPLILAGLDWLCRERPEIRTVRAEVLAANPASVKVFEAAGFSEHHKVFERHT